MLVPWKKSYDQPRQYIKKQRHYCADKGPYSQSDGFSNSHLWIWELDYKESWVQNNWCFWTVVLNKTLESPLGCKKIQPVNPEGNQSWIFIRNTDVETETPILWPWCKELTHLKRPWCWDRLRAGGEGDDRGWDGWTASLTQWTWVWASSGSWWWTGKSGVLQSMGSQRDRHDRVPELTHITNSPPDNFVYISPSIINSIILKLNSFIVSRLNWFSFLSSVIIWLSIKLFIILPSEASL